MSGASGPVRTAVVWCPDWPVTAAGYGPDVPAAVLSGNRVVACSAAARAEGVRRGHRRREAQARCPELRRARPRARPRRPRVRARSSRWSRRSRRGSRSCTRGSWRSGRAGRRATSAVTRRSRSCSPPRQEARLLAIGAPGVGVGSPTDCSPRCSPPAAAPSCRPGRSADILAPPDVSALQLTGAAGAGQAPATRLVDLLRRLGPAHPRRVRRASDRRRASRFDADGALAHRLARGLEPRAGVRPEHPGRPRGDARARPAGRAGRGRRVRRPDAGRSGCRTGWPGTGWPAPGCSSTARTEAGEEHARTWRNDGALTAAAIADRTRWQLDGWLSGRGRAARPTAGVSPAAAGRRGSRGAPGLQLDAAGAAGADLDARAHRALARVQGLLGPEAVLRPGARRRTRARASRSGWCRGRTSGSPPTRATGPGPAGSRPRTRPPSCSPPEPVEVCDAGGGP